MEPTAKLGRIRGRREEGFTLIELLMVVLIVAILAAVAIPTYAGQKQASRNAAAQSTVRTAIDAANAYYMSHGETYDGLDAAALNALEPAIQAIELGGATTVSGGANPQTAANVSRVFVGDGTDGTDPSGSVVTLCGVPFEGSRIFCARGDSGVWTYNRGNAATATQDTPLEVSAGVPPFSPTGSQGVVNPYINPNPSSGLHWGGAAPGGSFGWSPDAPPVAGALGSYEAVVGSSYGVVFPRAWSTGRNFNSAFDVSMAKVGDVINVGSWVKSSTGGVQNLFRGAALGGVGAAVPPDEWVWVSVSHVLDVAPSSGGDWRIDWEVVAAPGGGSLPAPGDFIRVAFPSFNINGPALDEPITGDMPGCDWLGTPNASPSIRWL